jgi:hypothetical protein
MNLRQTKALVATLGFTLSKRDGEYRLAPRGLPPDQTEAPAYYTNDLDDALATARAEYACTH